MVIEVKHGDTLKSFDVPMNESEEEIGIYLARLRAKISDLFSLTSDAEHMLTHFVDSGDEGGQEEIMMYKDEHLKKAALLHLYKLKAAYLGRKVNQHEDKGNIAEMSQLVLI